MANPHPQQADNDPWLIPLHGIAAPAPEPAPPPPPALTPPSEDAAITEHFYATDELPTIEFRPSLRRSA